MDTEKAEKLSMEDLPLIKTLELKMMVQLAETLKNYLDGDDDASLKDFGEIFRAGTKANAAEGEASAPEEAILIDETRFIVVGPQGIFLAAYENDYGQTSLIGYTNTVRAEAVWTSVKEELVAAREAQTEKYMNAYPTHPTRQ